MKIKAFYISGILFLLLAPCSEALDSHEPLRLDLKKALKIASSRHVDVIMSKERVSQALSRFAEARSSLLPQISSGASLSRQTRNIEAMGISFPNQNPLIGPFDVFDARISIIQALFDPSAIARLIAAKEAKLLSIAEYKKAESDVLALVSAIFFDAWQAEQAIEAADSGLELNRERLSVIEAKNSAGVGSSLELEKARADLDSSYSLFRSSIAEAIERELDLKVVLGIPYDQSVVLEEGYLDELGQGSNTSTILKKHPDIEAEEQRLKELKAERAASVADFLPKVSVAADYGLSGQRMDDSKKTYSYGAEITMPLFEGGLRAARYQEASSQVRSQEAVVNNVKEDVESHKISAEEYLRNARVRFGSSQKDLEVALLELALANHRLDNGLGDSLDVQAAYASARLAKNGLVASQALFRIAEVNLAHAEGDMDSLIKESDNQ